MPMRFLHLFYQNIRYSLAGEAVAVGVGGFCHLIVGGFVFEERFEVLVDGGFVGADEFERAGGDALRALGGIAHDKHGLAK